MRKWAAILLLIAGCTKPPGNSQTHAQRRQKHGDLQIAKLLPALDSSTQPLSTEEKVRLAMARGEAAARNPENDTPWAAYDEAADLAGSYSMLKVSAEIDLRRGRLYLSHHRPVEAEQMFRAMLKIAREISDGGMQAKAMGNLGHLFAETHRYDSGIYWFEQARAAFQKLGSPADVGRALGGLGWCYHRLGDDDRAFPYLEQAKKIAQTNHIPNDEQNWLVDLAGILFDRTDFRAAAENFRQALSIAYELKDPLLIRRGAENLAASLIGLGELDEAERFNRGASEADKKLNAREKKPKADLFIQVNSARIEALRGHLEQAEKLYRAAFTMPYDDPAPLIRAHFYLCELLVKMGNTVEADREYRSTFSQITSDEPTFLQEEFRFSYLSSVIKFTDGYVGYLVNRGERDRALEVTESIRARVLNESATQTGSGSTVSAAVLKRAAASSGSIFLSYWLSPERSLLWVVRPAGVELYPLPRAKPIAALASTYESLVESLRDPLASENPAGRQLSEILLGPVKEDLRRGAKFVVAPDRNLHSLNFETLPDPNNPARYLIETATLSVAPSLTLLATRERGVKPGRGSLLLIGDTNSPSPEYPRLPNASKEMALISQSFPNRPTVLSGTAAVPQAYLKSSPERYSAIHFAVHAIASRESPLDSALILSPGASDFRLTAREIMSVRLRADLVTLSACHSAGAKTYSGEGLVGLSWAFLRAGASSVVAGLWDVTDTSTANLMGDFYAQMAAGAAPADALRTAKLKLVHSSGAYRKPYYWAPFQLYAGRL